MRKIVFYGAVSLDGYLADAQQSLTWLDQVNPGDIMAKSYEPFINRVDTMIWGRNSFDYVIKNIPEFPYPNQQHFLFTSRPVEPLANLQVANTTPTQLVSKLVSKPGDYIWIVGGGGIVTELIESELVDELIIQIAPVLLGTGYKLFQDLTKPINYELKTVKQFGQFAEMTYTKKINR